MLLSLYNGISLLPSTDPPFLVPFKENAGFLGRVNDLARLHAALQGNGGNAMSQPVGIMPAGVTGMGGIGKTQLAVKYVYSYRDHYPDGIIWLNAARPLYDEFADLGRKLHRWQGDGTRRRHLLEWLTRYFDNAEFQTLCFDLSVKYDDLPGDGMVHKVRELVAYLERRDRLDSLESAIYQHRPEILKDSYSGSTQFNPLRDELVEAAFTWLKTHPQTLLVLDNLEDPATLQLSVSRNWVPTLLPVSLLFTTRQRQLSGCHPIELTVLPEDVALELLLRHPSRRMILQNPRHAEYATAREICLILGYLPLALEVAGAHLGQKATIGLTVYRQTLERRGALSVIDCQQLPVQTAHELGLRAVLTDQWYALPSDEARQLLQVAGQMPEAAQIPEARLGLLAGVIEESEDFFDDTPLSEAMHQLADASLVERLQSSQIRLHPLIHDFARGLTLDDEKETFRLTCANRLLTAYEDLPTLLACCAQHRIDALQEDLLAALELAAPHQVVQTEVLPIPPWRITYLHREIQASNLQSDIPHRLQNLLRLIQRDVHTLRGWQPKQHPILFAQQLAYRAQDLQFSPWLQNITRYLRQQIHPYIQVLWTNKRESLNLELTLTGHTGYVWAVAIAPDGMRAASASEDYTLKIWNLTTGQVEHNFIGHESEVNAVAITPDGRHAISASADSTIKVWNLITGQAERTFVGHGAGVQAVAITPDGLRAISASADSTLKVWNLTSGEPERILTGHEASVEAVAISPDGLRAISASEDSTLKLWNLATGKAERTLTGHEGSVQSVVITPDGRHAVSASEDSTLKVWNLATGEAERTLTGHEGYVWAVTITPDGRHAVSASEDCTLKVWNLTTGEAERTLTGHEDWLLAVAVTPDGTRAVSASNDRTLKVWNLTLGKAENVFIGHEDSVQGLAISPNSPYVVSASLDRTLKVWNMTTGQVERNLIGHEGYVWAVAITPDGRHAVSASEDCTLKIWNLTTGEVEFALIGHEDWVLAVAITPDGRHAVSASDDRSLRVWNLTTGEAECTLTGHEGYVWAVAVTPDGRHAVSASEDCTLKIWNLTTGEAERTLIGHKASVQGVAISPDGRRAVSASDDHTLKVWNLFTGENEGTLTGHVASVQAVTVSSDGMRVISACKDRVLKVWDLETKQELASISLDGALLCVTAALDGVTFVTGDGAGNVYCLRYVESGAMFEDAKRAIGPG